MLESEETTGAEAMRAALGTDVSGIAQLAHAHCDAQRRLTSALHLQQQKAMLLVRPTDPADAVADGDSPRGPAPDDAAAGGGSPPDAAADGDSPRGTASGDAADGAGSPRDPAADGDSPRDPALDDYMRWRHPMCAQAGEAPDEDEVVRLRSCSEEAGAFLRSIPHNPHFLLGNADFKGVEAQ